LSRKGNNIEFANITKYKEPGSDNFIVKIKPGDFYVTDNKKEILTTTLGSCIAVTIFERTLGVCGMNHFMLPFSKIDIGKFDNAARYGNWAMEMLINAALSKGALKNNLEVKIFGGGNVLDSTSSNDIGNKNIDFVKKYIKNENMKLISEDVGGNTARMLSFFSDGGIAKVRKVEQSRLNTIVNEEKIYFENIHGTKGNDVELF